MYTKLKEPSLTQHNFQIADQIWVYVFPPTSYNCVPLNTLLVTKSDTEKEVAHKHARYQNLEWKYFILIFMNSLWYMAPKLIWH